MRSQARSIVSRVQMSGGDRIIVSPVARIIMPLAIAWSRTMTAALPGRREPLLRRLVLDDLDRAHQADDRDLADQRMAGDALAQRLREIGPVSFRTRSTRPSRSMISRFFSATAQATGWPE